MKRMQRLSLSKSNAIWISPAATGRILRLEKLGTFEEDDVWEISIKYGFAHRNRGLGRRKVEAQRATYSLIPSKNATAYRLSHGHGQQ